MRLIALWQSFFKFMEDLQYSNNFFKFCNCIICSMPFNRYNVEDESQLEFAAKYGICGGCNKCLSSVDIDPKEVAEVLHKILPTNSEVTE